MSRRQLALLLTGVIVLHGIAFWLICGTNPLPKTPYIAPPNFMSAKGERVDPKTGERETLRQYQVTTRLAMPDALMEGSDPKTQ